jgi:hypothetical protein
MPTTYPTNPEYNFIDHLSRIKHYRVKEEIKANKIQNKPDNNIEVLLEGYRLCEPIPNKYKQELYGISGQDNAQYWLVHFDDLAGDIVNIGEKIEISYELSHPFVFVNRVKSAVIRLEIKNIITSGLSVSTIEAICIEY